LRFTGSALKYKMVKSNIDCVYCVIITGPYNDFHDDRYTCTMDHANYLKLKNHIDRYITGFNFYAIPVAYNVTPLQLKKFSNYHDSKAISEVLKWFEFDSLKWWKDEHKDKLDLSLIEIRTKKRHQLLYSIPGDKDYQKK